jgi:putative oxidoreductase
MSTISMRHCFYCETVGRLGSAGLLVLRLVMGTAFVLHGWSKIQNPLGWMGPDAVMPGILQALAAVSEFGGGIALVFGLLTRLASLGIAAVMVVALATVHLPLGQPFVSRSGGPSFELPAVYLACAIALLLLGPGRCSLDALLFRQPLGTKPHQTAS